MLSTTAPKINVNSSTLQSPVSPVGKPGKSTEENKVWKAASKPGKPKTKVAVGINPQKAEPVEQGPVGGHGRKKAVVTQRRPMSQALSTFSEMQVALNRPGKREDLTEDSSSQDEMDSSGSGQSTVTAVEFQKDPKAPKTLVVPPIWTLLNSNQPAREAFMQPISAEAGAALKKAVAKTTVFGFEPKWFRDEKRELNHCINLLNDRLDKAVYEGSQEHVFNRANAIYEAVRGMAGAIERRRKNDPCVELLRRDASILKDYLAKPYWEGPGSVDT